MQQSREGSASTLYSLKFRIDCAYSGCTAVAKYERRCNASSSDFTGAGRQKLLARCGLPTFGAEIPRSHTHIPSGMHLRLRALSAIQNGGNSVLTYLRDRGLEFFTGQFLNNITIFGACFRQKNNKNNIYEADLVLRPGGMDNPCLSAKSAAQITLEPIAKSNQIRSVRPAGHIKKEATPLRHHPLLSNENAVLQPQVITGKIIRLQIDKQPAGDKISDFDKMNVPVDFNQGRNICTNRPVVPSTIIEIVDPFFR